MALVAYNDSDFSDSESEQTEASTKIAPLDKPEELFDSLPTPKAAAGRPSEVEEDDEFLKKKEVPSEKPPPKSDIKNAKRKPAQIFLPSLSSFNDDEDDADSQPKFKKISKGSGLLNMLPKPKADMFVRKPSTSFIPNILNKSTPKPLPSKTTVKSTNKNIKKPQNDALITNYSSSEGSDVSDSEDKPADFFSLNEDPNLTDIPLEIEDIPDEQIPTSIAPNVTNDSQAEYYRQYIDDYKSAEEPEEIPADEPMTDEALIKLASSRERLKGEAIQIIDINQAEIMPDSREWLTKALTENAPTQVTIGKRSGGDFTSQQRRKHQITYLASQARANEQALQNQWANNRLTRKQTQSKYGF